jgi:hypothetical protein
MRRNDRRDERFAIRFSRAEKRALERLAEQQDLTAAQVVRRAVKLILVQQEAVTN